MSFLFPKAPTPPPPPNPATPAPKTNAFADPRPNPGSFIGSGALFKTKTQKNSLIGGG
jgi:hypothetical protein